MIRVGFAIGGEDGGWTGGANYIENLLHAVAALPDRQIEIALMVPPDASNSHVARFPADHVIRTAAFQRRAPLRLAGKMLERVIDRNLPTDLFLRRHRIDVLSHAPPLGARSTTPTISWIPDFQERHLPDFFSGEEIARRTRGQRTIVSEATRVLLSSQNARDDLIALYPDARAKARVLHFVSAFGGANRPSDEARLRDEYRLTGPYFHLPNQLWVHKNHAVVVKALAILKAQGVDATVVCTGGLRDYRHPDFHARFIDTLARAGVADRMRIEGLVPYGHVAAFLRHCVAVINPSLFEGWSTTVEEAKSLGKRILLSDIAVHREQAPPRGSYFAPEEAEALADLMRETLAAHDPAAEAAAAADAAAALPGRVRDFARRYEAIALDAAATG